MIRNENVRPYLIRKNSQIISLNGQWDFEFDDKNIGHKEKWFFNHDYSKKIEVPFPYQSKLSGICDPTFHDYIWYQREIKLKKEKNKNYILNFNGVDYYCEVYLNGCLIKTHKGSSTSFIVNLTSYMNEEGEKNIITVFCYDSSTKQDFPRGKQYWKENSESIFYTRTSGIYKNVYLEILESNFIESHFITPDIDKGVIEVETKTLSDSSKIIYEVSLKGEVLNKVEVKTDKERVTTTIKVWDEENIDQSFFHNEKYLWTPKNPLLYDLRIKVLDSSDKVLDEIETYFGMRKVSSKNGIFLLNNRPFYQKLVLIQGYFKDGLLSYPSVDSLEKDILMAKEMGFNGGRIHQKVEDPYFYYLCDKLGFICWLECPSGQVFDKKLVTEQTNEWIDVVKQNYNFPSIFVLVPLNESWGVPYLPYEKEQENYQNGLYYLTKSLDKTRLVVGNDGWEMAKTDICSIHNYRHGCVSNLIEHQRFEESLKDKETIVSSMPGNKVIFLKGYENQDVPYMLTEFGGISFVSHEVGGWGYTSCKDGDEFLKEYRRIITSISKSTALVGMCYTQLYDVEQEINGLLTYEREYKVDPAKVKEINDLISKYIEYTK